MGKNNRSFFFFISLSAALLGAIFISLGLENQKIGENKDIAACDTKDFSESQTNEKVAVFEKKTITVPEIKDPKKGLAKLAVLGASTDRWVEIDLSEQKLKAWEGDKLFLETSISSGLPWSPTPTGEFRIWTKFRATKMEGGQGKYYYYLPNVPYVMFFENDQIPGRKGYGLHGTYWHNDFGTPRSHGCVNLPTSIAEQLYYWTTPNLPDGKKSIAATSDNPGTKIVIHD